MRQVDTVRIFPATHYVAGRAYGTRYEKALRRNWKNGWPSWRPRAKLLEAQRLRMRTTYDLEMMRQVGFCSGIENYSRHTDGRGAGLHRRR